MLTSYFDCIINKLDNNLYAYFYFFLENKNIYQSYIYMNKFLLKMI